MSRPRRRTRPMPDDMQDKGTAGYAEGGSDLRFRPGSFLRKRIFAGNGEGAAGLLSLPRGWPSRLVCCGGAGLGGVSCTNGGPPRV